MLRYLIKVANGDVILDYIITEVRRVVVENDVYILYNKDGKVLFSAPTNSLVCLTVN